MIALTLLEVAFALLVSGASIGVIAWLLAGAPDLRASSISSLGAFLSEHEAEDSLPEGPPISFRDCA